MEPDKSWLLALDLSTRQGELVLDGPSGNFHREIAGDSRVSHLFPAAHEIMSDAGVGPREVGLIGVGRGPGSFTGVRVAVTAAKIIAAVRDIPLVAPDTLMVMAAGAEGTGKPVFTALDARRGEVYYALYRMEDGYPVAITEPCVASPHVAAASLSSWMDMEGTGVIGVGNGIEAYPTVWPEGMEAMGRSGPGPVGLTQMCRLAEERGELCDPIMLVPLYLRRPDASERYGNKGGGPC